MLSLLIADECSSIYKTIALFCKNFAEICLYPCAHNCSEVLEVLQTKHVDALLMDLLLPPHGCLEALETTQAMKKDCRPFVFIQASNLDNRAVGMLQKYNVAYCFIKPLGPELIIPRILQLIRSTDTLDVNPNHIAKQTTAHNEKISSEITQQIRSLGIPAHLKGYHFLRSAIKYSVCSKEPSTIAVTKDIYPNISLQYNTTPALVERSIRNAIEVAWARGNINVLHSYFGFTIDSTKGKPTNSEFIAMVADKVRLAVNC